MSLDIPAPAGAETARLVAPLFTPFKSGAIELKNRLAMAPMTRSHSPDGVPGPEVADYYRRRAANDVGLLITEGTPPARPAAHNDLNVPHFYGAESLAGWARVVAGVHAEGARIWPQIWHVGAFPNRRAPEIPGRVAESPSGVFAPGKAYGQAMAAADIDATINAYAEAARVARELGFDGVEIHGAHGYLIDQFFWSGANSRGDGYDGDMVARTRFAVEIIEAVRAATAPDYPICFRFSQWKQQDFAARLAQSPEELGAFLAPLAAAGVDVFHCSTRRFWEPEFEGSPLNLAGWTKKLTGLPVMTVGSVGLSGEFVAAMRGEASQPSGLDSLIERLEAGEFDLVAVGRALLQDPEWARKVKDGRQNELLAFTADAMGVYY